MIRSAIFSNSGVVNVPRLRRTFKCSRFSQPRMKPLEGFGAWHHSIGIPFLINSLRFFGISICQAINEIHLSYFSVGKVVHYYSSYFKFKLVIYSSGIIFIYSVNRI